MGFPEADRQIIEGHSIRNLRRDYRQTFIASTGLRVEDVQEKPEILNLMLKNATAVGGRLLFTPPVLISSGNV